MTTTSISRVCHFQSQAATDRAAVILANTNHADSSLFRDDYFSRWASITTGMPSAFGFVMAVVTLQPHSSWYVHRPRRARCSLSRLKSYVLCMYCDMAISAKTRGLQAQSWRCPRRSHVLCIKIYA